MNVEQQNTSSTRLPEAVYRQRRINVALAAIAAIVVAVFGLTGGIAGSPKVETEMVTITVTNGDSLWTLADRFAPENQDPREWIYQVQQENGLETSALFPGMRLTVPMAVTPADNPEGR